MPSAPFASVDLLYSNHAAWLGSWLRRHTRCAVRAEDLVQETFCRLLEAPHGARVDNPQSYLATVARRLLIDDIRHREIERAYLAAAARLDDGTNPITPERIAEAVQLLGALARLLGAMPRQTREAFLLRRLDGLSHAAIAARLGISDRTVKRHIARAYAACFAFAYPAE